MPTDNVVDAWSAAIRVARSAVRPDRVGDEQVVDPGRGHHLGLADRSDGQSRRTGRELQPRDRDALVGLRVRSKRHAACAGRVGHPRKVAVDDLEIDDKARRDEPGGKGGDDRGDDRGGVPCDAARWRHSVGPAPGGALAQPWLVIA